MQDPKARTASPCLATGFQSEPFPILAHAKSFPTLQRIIDARKHNAGPEIGTRRKVQRVGWVVGRLAAMLSASPPQLG